VRIAKAVHGKEQERRVRTRGKGRMPSSLIARRIDQKLESETDLWESNVKPHLQNTKTNMKKLAVRDGQYPVRAARTFKKGRGAHMTGRGMPEESSPSSRREQG